ncbi:hypothetical protein CDD82_1955 [Ophiocordyceps australis]|uniref:Uncharacterized protein n=1 Tax=Ophiocordyceps australis TaxID=1399860 RepID=A0A2C5Y7D1_9HYPO|nr:hypothetical protein CDD82_1955 [Ophiocordyceps australis]
MHIVSDGVYSSLFRPPPAPRGKVPRRPPSMVEAAAKRRRISGRWEEEEEEEEKDEGDAARGWRHCYTLAGQVGDEAGGEGLRESMYSDSSYRRLLGSKRRREDEDDDDEDGGAHGDVVDPTRPTPLLGRGIQPQTAPLQTWSSACLTRLGGMVGKMWQFCRVASFKGFHAGGAHAFSMPPPDSCYAPPRRFDHGLVASRPVSPSRPAVKRRQTAPPDDLCRNWVMVDKTRPRPLPDAAPSPPSASSSPSAPSTASFAPPRSPLGHAASPSLPRPATCPRPCTSFAPPSRRSPHRRALAHASTASSRAPDLHSRRLDPEARALTMQRKLHDQETEVRMASLNRRLQDMIRQGKEALGTRVHVEDEPDWEDEL